MFGSHQLAEIKRRTRLSDLIGEFVSLRRTGRDEWAGRCPFHHERTPSFSVSDRKRFYHCFGCGAHGDAIAWVIETTSADTFVEAVEYLVARCGLCGNSDLDAKPPHQALSRAVDHYDADRRRAAAQRVFLTARPLVAGDPVWRYLSGRGLGLAQLARPSRALRYHPSCWNSETRQDMPAMVAAVVAGDGCFLACHRTFLEVAPSGAVRKAPLRNPKVSLGTVVGGAIRLARGAAGKPWRRADPDEEIVGTEGIEDGLAAAVMMSDRRVVATIWLGNLRNLILPPGVSRLLWCEQNDAFDSGAKRQLAAAVAELRERHVRVRFLRPPVFVKDLAEYQQRLASAA